MEQSDLGLHSILMLLRNIYDVQAWHNFLKFRMITGMISCVDLAHYGISRAKDWVSVDCDTRYI